MNRMFIAAALAVSGFCFVASAAAPSLPVVEILGKHYYVYEIKKGDSLFGIAREYGWDDKELKRLNPTATSPLKKGAKIYYPLNDAENALPAVAKDPEEAGLLSPLTHTVKRGETVYSISLTYGIPVETIYSLNSGARKGISAGETLTLRRSELRDRSQLAGYYTVKKGDTLYKVAREHGVTVAAILKENPGVSEHNFKAESIIKLPPAGTGITMTRDTVEQSTLKGFDVYKAGKEESWTSIARRHDVSEGELREANPGVSKVKNNQLISIPKIETVEVEREVVKEDPRELSSEGVADIYEDVHRISADLDGGQVNVAIVLSDPSANRDMEFTRGFLTSVDDMKKSGVKINVKVMDGTDGSTEILTALDDFKPSVVFVTNDSGVPAYLSEYSTVACVPLVNAFDVKSEDYTENPYIVQLMAPSSYFNDEIADYVASNYKGYVLLMVGAEDEQDQLIASLRERWTPTDMISLPDSDLSTYSFTDGNRYVVYGNSVSKGEVSKLLDAVGESRDANPAIEIKVVGRPNWILFDESLSDLLHKQDVLIPSRFYFDKDAGDSKRFIANYKRLFDRSPLKSFPVYAAMGYDCADYFVKQIEKHDGDLNKFGKSGSTLQIPFRFRRPSNWTGLLNPAVYMVRFTPYDMVEKIIVE